MISRESLDQTRDCADCDNLAKEEFQMTDEVRMFLRAPLPSSLGTSSLLPGTSSLLPGHLFPPPRAPLPSSRAPLSSSPGTSSLFLGLLFPGHLFPSPRAPLPFSSLLPGASFLLPSLSFYYHQLSALSPTALTCNRLGRPNFR